MKDKELNEKESLELIARMIRNTRRNLDTGSGNSFLVWGYVGVLVTLAVWAGVTFTGNPVWMWGFWGIPVVGYLLMFLLLRKRQKPVKFYLDKILERVWGVFGMVCMMGVLAATDAGRTKLFCLCVPSSSRWAASLRAASFAILRFLSSRCLAFYGG